MYQVNIYNNGQETQIHVPFADKESPHLLGASLVERLSNIDIFSFFIPYQNPGYNLVNSLNTKIKVIDTRDNSVKFVGRIMPTKNSMDINGTFTKEIDCESALGYLNDTHTRRKNFTNQTPTQIFTYWLNDHNSKVDSSRQIQLGTIELTQALTIDTNYETTLNAIVTKVRNILGGDLSVRESNGVLYLDYLINEGANNNVDVRLGQNMKSIVQEYDPGDLITRIIPLGYGDGVNQLTINSVNSNVEYVEDTAAISQYGLIEGVITNIEIQDAGTLKTYGITVLSEKKYPKLILNTEMLDRSVLNEFELEKFYKGDTLHIINEVMNLDVYARVIESTTDILQPQNRSVVISTKPIRLTDAVIDLKQRNLSLENAPQGSTCIYALSKAENADASHPIEFDLDIPDEAININRVYINLHGRPYRAYEKDTAAGGGVTSGASSSSSSSSGGDHTHLMFSKGESTGPPFDNPYVAANGQTVILSTISYQDLYTAGSSGDHTHNIAHTHNIQAHSHEQTYGIYEGTYPNNVRITINGVDFGVNYGDGSNEFDYYSLNITPYVSKGNNKIQISTSQNGRIEANIYSQIFIQSK